MAFKHIDWTQFKWRRVSGNPCRLRAEIHEQRYIVVNTEHRNTFTVPALSCFVSDRPDLLVNVEHTCVVISYSVFCDFILWDPWTPVAVPLNASSFTSSILPASRQGPH